jgi:hypothetical protein
VPNPPQNNTTFILIISPLYLRKKADSYPLL